jgi:DNA polymerase elongation subunit (family B)
LYQAIYYDFQSYSVFLRDSESGWSNFKPQHQMYKRVPSQCEDALPILTGGWCVPLPLGKFDKADPNILEKDINKELLVLRDRYYQFDDKIPEWQNTLLLDIEIEMGGALTPQYIKDCPKPITSIALLDKTLKQSICFIVDSTKQIQEINENNKIIIPCINENDLLSKFLDKWEELDPTIVSTWNGHYFDIPYLYFRLQKIVGIEQALRLSPIRKVNVQTWNPLENNVRIGGVNHLDYMLLFKKYIPKQEPSYKLKDIGLKYVNLGKIEYEGNLDKLFKEDKEKFIEYNIRDCVIIEELEKKLKFIEITILLSHICNIPYDQVYHNTVMNEGAILKFLKRKGIISPNKPTTHNPNLKGQEEKYAGGFLLDPEVGLYIDVIDLDFTSEYPSVIKSLNLGIETLVGRIKVLNKPNYEQNHSLEKLKLRDPEELIILQRLNKESYKLESTQVSIGKLIQIIEESNYTISASGAIFRTDIKSCVAEILEGWFNKREYYRELKKKSGKNEDWSNYKLFDSFQYVFKILQNAMYGTFAKNGWRYTDGYMICSSAITNSGQRLVQESITFVEEIINDELGCKQTSVIMSDTDSLYIKVGELINHRYPILDLKDKNFKILEIAAEIQDKANLNLDNISKNLFNIKEKHYFQLKQEVIASTLLATGKRRYGMHITNKEGVVVDEIVLMGLEVMKSNINPIFKEFGTNFIRRLLTVVPKNELDSSIIELYKSLNNIDPKILGKPIGVKNILQYIKRKPLPGTIFSELVLGTPFNSRAAIVYNDLLKFKKIDTQYESILEGDKISVINLKNNPYHVETIGLPNGSKIPPELQKFVENYIDVESIFESSILEKLKELYKDLGWDFPVLNSKIYKFFKF